MRLRLGVLRDTTTQESASILALLKACAKHKDLLAGGRLHAHILRTNVLERNSIVASALVNMYAKCGALAKAARVLNEFPVRDVVTWNALIAGYVQKGQDDEALKCFETMQRDGLYPDAVTFTCILKACGSKGVADEGEKIHEAIVRQELVGKDIVLGTSLVDMYAKCGLLVKAERVLENLPARNVISWSALIAGYAQHGQGDEALMCFERMHCEGLPPNAVTFICALRACGSIGATEKGEHIHKEILRRRLLDNDAALGNALVDMYIKCGAVAKAEEVLDDLPVRNAISYNTLMALYAQQEEGKKTLHWFQRMQHEGLSPNLITFICILKACGTIGAIDKGEQVHKEIVRQGLLVKSTELGNTLIDMYVNFGTVTKAARVLDELAHRNVVSWNALIAGYVQQGQAVQALYCFRWMQSEGHLPNRVSFICTLKACACLRAVNMGKEIHSMIVRQGLLGKDFVLDTTLVDMYARCGVLVQAAQTLNGLCIQNVVTWNALLAACAQQGEGEKALLLFEQMQNEGTFPDATTFTSILKACANLGAADKGEEFHLEIVRRGLLGQDIVLDTALVDMYAKCGIPLKALRVLDELPVRNVVSWSTVIAGYAQQGQGEESLKCFEGMQNEGLSPDRVTLACVLSVCSRLRLMQEGQLYFAYMSTKYGLSPDLEHYTCMVDLFGRVGEFDKAVGVIMKIPSSDRLTGWRALMGACQECGYVELGELAFENALEIDKNDAASYILMCKIHAATGMVDHVMAENLEGK